MAKKVIVELVDDFDGKSKAEETVVFGIDGSTYEIDLSVLNASALRGVLEQWTQHARKVGRIPKSSNKTTPRTSTNRGQTAAVREWARKNGYNVSSRGRIQADILEAYNRAS
ncbi:histone-like nucleoid-structuring protein Lsr2 [Nocardia transvalensis]|uniref:histone-like nucleoid-structuring protein Lsr2 n=1 Tax=Nocardia transvalensis TaxID=37333 RepID=UPI001896001C|nr:Lsr2 family protein [Nocardia transvalensis]MBF6331830.1 Lsr2 family protein [Nocardia transvalensis]